MADFQNPATQEDKQEVLKNETYFSRARTGIDLDEPAGRFAAAAYFSGSEPSTSYPAASGPWNDPVRVPVEPSLGVDITIVEPVGTAAEIERSLEQFADDAKPAGPLAPGLGNAKEHPSKAPSAIPMAASPAPTAAHPSSPAEVTPPLATERDAAIHARLGELAPKMFRRRRV